MIFSGDEKEIAEIKKENDDNGFRLVRRKDGMEWSLDRRVHGELRPFSFSVRKLARAKDRRDVDGDVPSKDEMFVVREQMFKHNGNFYMMAGHPAGKHWDEHVNGAVRYISRLDGFDDDDAELSQIDYHHRNLRDKIKRLRGTAVGEASGLGTEERGHRVQLDDELADVGLFIAAISYLIYASA